MSKHKMGLAQRRELIGTLILIIIVIVFTFSRQSEDLSLRLDEDRMVLVGPEAAPFTVEIGYGDILSISETDDLDTGTYLTGVFTDRCWYGTWQNDTFGEYTLCALPSVKQYIVIETSNGIVVCNFESDGTTQGLYAALTEQLEEQRQAG